MTVTPEQAVDTVNKYFGRHDGFRALHAKGILFKAAFKATPEAAEFTPFCSRGCNDRDLLKWLGEGYRIPGPPADPERVDTSGSGD